MVGYLEGSAPVGSVEATVLWTVVGIALAILILASVYGYLWITTPYGSLLPWKDGR